MKIWINAAAIALLGCAHLAPAPDAGPWVTSDSSQYSPVAHFRAFTAVSSAGVSIAIDSGSLLIPGVFTPEAPPLMSNLYLTAILAVGERDSLAIVMPADG